MIPTMEYNSMHEHDGEGEGKNQVWWGLSSTQKKAAMWARDGPCLRQYFAPHHHPTLPLLNTIVVLVVDDFFSLF